MKSFLEDNNAPIIPLDYVELFDSLDDMWLFNWQEFNKEGDSKWLIKNEHQRNRFIDPNRADKKFLQLTDDWFKLIGNNTNREELYVIMKKCIEARDKVIKGDRFQIVWVNKYEQMMSDLMEDNTGADPNKERAALSIAVGFSINKRTTTVVDYYAYLDVIIEKNKQKTPTDG